LESQGLFIRVKFQQMVAISVQNRSGRNHFGIEQHLPGNQTRKITEMTVRPIHHGSNAQNSLHTDNRLGWRELRYCRKPQLPAMKLGTGANLVPPSFIDSAAPRYRQRFGSALENSIRKASKKAGSKQKTLNEGTPESLGASCD
jgi:hypothetical protein